MKKNLYLQLVIVLFLLNNVSVSATMKESAVKSALTKIFDMSKNKNYTDSAPLLFNKKLITRAYNYTDKSEIKAVKRICKKIKAYLDLSDSYEYEAISFSKDKNLQSANLKVNFQSGNQELTISFIFVEISGKILLSSFK